MKPLLLISLISLLGLALCGTAAAQMNAVNAANAQILAETDSLNPKPIEVLTAAEARLQPLPGDGYRKLLAKRDDVPALTGLERVYDLMIEGAAGPLPARVYKPAGAAPLPVILYFHGGGWVLADLDAYEASAYNLAKKSGAVVLSVEYSKAPEHRFPAAHEDAVAAYRWVLNHAGRIGGDPQRVAVAGESAGGNLALNVAIWARDNVALIPRHVLAVYPVAGNDMNNESYRQNESARPLNKAMMTWFFRQYVGSVEAASNPRLNLVTADLQRISSVTLITAQVDPLRTEGELLRQRLEAAGVPVSHHHFAGVTHEFFGLADVIPQAAQAQDLAAAELKSALARTAASANR